MKIKKRRKEKERSSSTVDELDIASNSPTTITQTDKSYSDVDYFPMMPKIYLNLLIMTGRLQILVRIYFFFFCLTFFVH